MEPFVAIHELAAPIDEANMDTNQLCPTRFNKLARHDPDYVHVLFNNQRFFPDGTRNPEFILNQPPFDKAGVLVADRNWGCGSSRESAVYALLAFGIKAVIAPSFGDIHYANALKNGLLPVVLPRATCDELRLKLHAAPGLKIHIDLEQQTVQADQDTMHHFDIQASRKRALLLGQDDIDMTMEFAADIKAFEQHYRPTLPWLYQ